RVQIGWSAADDYGLTEVTLLWQRAGAKEERVVLQTPASPAKRLRGAYTWEIAPLRLRPGDRVSYHLEAKDNDAVDGPQRGVSPTQAIKVFSAAEHNRESLIRAQALWERLVALLGDRLEEKRPPGQADAAAQWYAQTGKKDRDARALSQELYAAGTDLLKDKLAPKALGRALRYASTGLGPTVHRTSLARAPLSRGATSRDGALRGFNGALQAEIREEEKDVLYLEDLLDRARLDAMQELGKELASSRRELARLAEKLQNGKIDDALRQLDKLSQQLERLEKDLQQKAGQQQSGQYAQEARALREAADQLRELQAKEQDLEKKTAQLRREMQSQAQKRFDQKGGKELAKQLKEKAEAARKAISQIDPRVAEHLG